MLAFVLLCLPLAYGVPCAIDGQQSRAWYPTAYGIFGKQDPVHNSPNSYYKDELGADSKHVYRPPTYYGFKYNYPFIGGYQELLSTISVFTTIAYDKQWDFCDIARCDFELGGLVYHYSVNGRTRYSTLAPLFTPPAPPSYADLTSGSISTYWFSGRNNQNNTLTFTVKSGNSDTFTALAITNIRCYGNDVNECDLNNGGCGNPVVTSCVDLVGQPPLCVDVDECALGTDTCGTALCLNTPGSFECYCEGGFDLICNSTYCECQDKCLTNNGECGSPELATCINNNTDIYCEINECAMDPTICGTLGIDICVDKLFADGGYFCYCAPGYLPKQDNCTQSCACHSKCSVGNGGCGDTHHFSCSLVEGDVVCSDVNECQSNACGSPSLGNTCNNTYGSFVCGCMIGTVNTTSCSFNSSCHCQDVNECQLNPCGNFSSGNTCHNTLGSFQCGCSISTINTTLCLSTSSCACQDRCSQNGPCGSSDHWTCLNSQDGTVQCQDVNECEVQSPCGPNTVCTNRPGTYGCECALSFISKEGTQCNGTAHACDCIHTQESQAESAAVSTGTVVGATVGSVVALLILLVLVGIISRVRYHRSIKNAEAEFSKIPTSPNSPTSPTSPTKPENP